MDPITHGIAGALLGKAYFSERHGKAATFAATLGAVFPDIDTFFNWFSRDPLALLKYHRAFTHSFLGLPLFAAALGWGTRWCMKRRGAAAPSWLMLSVIYGIGIASHIILDGMTSFGTRMWHPLSSTRVAWDLLFIIDFTFTAIILVPQVLAWVHKERRGAPVRAAAMSALFCLAAAGVWALTRSLGIGFSLGVLAGICGALAAIFLLPLAGGWGSGISRPQWCRAGVWVMAAYLLACGFIHHRALAQVEQFARAQNIHVERLGALPLPPSLLVWGGMIRTDGGVYMARMALLDPGPPAFEFLADSVREGDLAKAEQLPGVRTYLWFTRFPSLREETRDGETFLYIRDVRFAYPGRKSPVSFAYRVVFDAEGDPVEDGWAVPRRHFGMSGDRPAEREPGSP